MASLLLQRLGHFSVLELVAISDHSWISRIATLLRFNSFNNRETLVSRRLIMLRHLLCIRCRRRSNNQLTSSILFP